MIDRFGPLPDSVCDLIETVRLRWIAERLGFEKVMIKNQALKCYFLPSDNEAYFQSTVFGKILTYAQMHPKRCKMKEYKARLILKIEEVLSIEEAKSIFQEM